MTLNFAPQSLVWAPGGTRRYSKLEQIDVRQYPSQLVEKQVRESRTFFDLGVKTVFIPVITPNNFREQGVYRTMLNEFVPTLFTSKEMLNLYRENQIRVKFYGYRLLANFLGNKEAFLDDCLHTMEETKDFAHTLWWGFAADEEEMLWDVIQSGMQSKVLSFDELILNYYGERLEQVDMLIATGKFQCGSLLPPLLGQKAALYWTDFPGNMITTEDIERIFEDFAIARETWVADKGKRLESFDPDKVYARYERRIIWGIGSQEYGYWLHNLNEE